MNDYGAEVIIVSGFLWETTIYMAQTLYPNTDFILIDGEPHNDEYTDYDVSDHTFSAFFNEEEAGFLAGYAAVKDGYRALGFMGGMAVPPVVRYGIGYIAGAYYAANELDVNLTFGSDQYIYTGSFTPDNYTVSEALNMYTQGTEVIFAVNGSGVLSVMVAAEDKGKKVIGVDVDLSMLSETVLTSAIKQIDVLIYRLLEDYAVAAVTLGEYFHFGESIYYGIESQAVGLSFSSSRFTSFTQQQYDEIYERISYGNVNVPDDWFSLEQFLNSMNASYITNFDQHIVTGIIYY